MPVPSQAVFEPNVLDHDDCFGEFPYTDSWQLLKRDTQLYSFTDPDNGPYWMTKEQQEQTKNDISTSWFTEKNLTKEELVRAIQQGIPMPPLHLEKKPVRVLRELAEQNNIATKRAVEKFTKGWLNKPKGLEQICWEHQLISSDHHDSKDYNKLNLLKLLSKCHDFKNEISLVEWIAQEHGWKVIFSPKAHPEIMGCGIEYAWAVSKNCLQLVPLEERKGRDNFDEQF